METQQINNLTVNTLVKRKIKRKNLSYIDYMIYICNEHKEFIELVFNTTQL